MLPFVVLLHLVLLPVELLHIELPPVELLPAMVSFYIMQLASVVRGFG